MNHIIIKLLLISVLAINSMFSFSQTTTIQVGSTTRTLYVYAPACLTQNRPLLISMHGMGQDINYQKNQAQWELVADTANFLVVYPAGVNNAWDISGTSDTDFISAIINEMYSKYKIDKNRIYLSGFSMGGMMTYHAMNVIADKIAAFAPVSGYPVAGAVFTSSRPIPIIHTNGDADDVVHYEAWSGTFNGMYQNQIGAEAMAQNWANSNGCDATPEITMVNNCATRRLWKNGDCGVEVCLNKLPNKGHWHSNDEACYHTSREIWKFIRRYTLECGSSSELGVALTLSDTISVAPASVSMEATSTNQNMTISHIDFYANGELLQSEWVAPYSFDWTNVAAGTYTVKAIAYDTEGNTAVDSATLIVNVPQSPYGGVAHSIPGQIEAEDYDLGGEGFAYHDATAGNSGEVYRNDGVDITGDATVGYMVGWTAVDEWLEYTVNVKEAGVYNWSVRVSSGLDGSSFRVYLNDLDITGKIEVANGGDWDTYSIQEGQTPSLAVGEQVMRIVVEGAYCNIDWISFTNGTVGLDLEPEAEQQLEQGIYHVYGLLGEVIGSVYVSDGKSLNDELNGLNLRQGIYLLKSPDMKRSRLIHQAERK